MSRRHNKGKTEGEKPFWISYADLMTGMMVLFLITMATMMVIITRKVRHVQAKEVIRSQQIKHICQSIQKSLSTDPVVHVDCQDNRISFGEVGRFAHNDYHLPPQAGPALARLLPVVLHAADDPLGRRWRKQVIIEGYTDTDGSYLYNLHLSLERSEWVMCLLLDARLNRNISLSQQEIQQVKNCFLPVVCRLMAPAPRRVPAVAWSLNSSSMG